MVLVRTKGAWSGGGDRSWLLIKHRDDWAGDVDIAEFAPLSIKSEGDFADILAQDNPAIWISHRPAEGGETGAMFRRSSNARWRCARVERRSTRRRRRRPRPP